MRRTLLLPPDAACQLPLRPSVPKTSPICRPRNRFMGESMRERAGWPSCWWRAGIWCGAALALVVAACSGREGRAAQAALSERPLAPIDWEKVDAAPGHARALEPDRAYKTGVPR